MEQYQENGVGGKRAPTQPFQVFVDFFMYVKPSLSWSYRGIGRQKLVLAVFSNNVHQFLRLGVSVTSDGVCLLEQLVIWHFTRIPEAAKETLLKVRARFGFGRSSP